MAEQAKISSIEAISQFRAALVTYAVKARSVLEEVDQERLRLRTWLQSDRRTYWEGELRRRQRRLDEKQQELLSAKLSSLQSATSAQALAVDRARQAVRQAEEKCQAIKRWSREFDNRSEPIVRQLGPMHGVLAVDLVKAAAQLDRLLQALETYTTSTQGNTRSPIAAPQTPEGLPNTQALKDPP